MCALHGQKTYTVRPPVSQLLLYGAFVQIFWTWSFNHCRCGISRSAPLCSDAYWCWLKQRTYVTSVLAGMVLGLALLTKAIAIFLLIVFPIMLVVWVLLSGKPTCLEHHTALSCKHKKDIREKPRWTQQLLTPTSMQVAVLLATCTLAINIGYGFKGSFQPLHSYRFLSSILRGGSTDVDGGNCFNNSYLARLPIPLPKAYVASIDSQKAILETPKGGLPSRSVARRRMVVLLYIRTVCQDAARYSSITYWSKCTCITECATERRPKMNCFSCSQ